MNLGTLDQKLWVALACPTEGLEFDKRTLELLDADADGRIRAPALIAAARWAGSMVKDPDSLLEGTATIPLASFDTRTEEGKQLLASAKEILRNLGKKEAKEISLEDTLDTEKIFAKTKFNGDGIVPASSTDDEAVQAAVVDIIACVGAEADRSGEEGISQAKVEAFFTDAEALDAWWRRAEADAARVLPLGSATTAAVESFRAVRAKIDDYFTRCRVAAFDPRAAIPMNRSEDAYASLGLGQLSATAEALAELPLACVEPNKALPLAQGLNPAWIAAMTRFRSDVVKPLQGDKTSLTDADWAAVSATLEAFEAWRATKPVSSLETLGRARVAQLLAGGALKKQIDELIAKDKALEPQFTAMASVEKLLRYHRDLAVFAHNFVSFRDFYSKKKAIFQAGTLYLDQRSCELCIKVADAAAHSALATLSGTYLVYLDCKRKGSADPMTIAAAFSDGDSDNLMVGRNGIFYDRAGHDWDACITKIVSHPISIREAFWLPYKRAAKLINEQIEKFASSRDKELHEKTAAGVQGTASSAEQAQVAPAAPEAAPAPFDVARFAGIFAAIGLALGAIGSMLAAVGSGFISLRWWQMPLVLLGLMLLISGPSMILAWLKLRRRNLGPILDASGWAVNARAKLNIPFGRSLTAVARLPEGAERSLDDPYAQGSKAWLFWLVLAVALGGLVAAWRLGWVTKEMVLGAGKAPSSASPSPPTR